MNHPEPAPDGKRIVLGPPRTRGFWLRFGGVCLLVFALGGSIIGINAIAYLAGLGREVTVTVTHGSGHRSQGHGYYESGAGREYVRMSGVEEGDVLHTRMPLIPLGFGNGPSVNAHPGGAVQELALSAITVLLVVGGVKLIRTGNARAARSREFYGEPDVWF